MASEATAAITTGGCLCGAVRYEISGPLRDVIACHCRQCRRATGHYYAATAVKRHYLTLTETRGLRWYQSSSTARRGFCAMCGSNLLWDAAQYPHVSITAGSLDDDSNLRLVRHIFVAEQGGYYVLADGVTQVAGRAHGISVPD